MYVLYALLLVCMWQDLVTTNKAHHAYQDLVVPNLKPKMSLLLRPHFVCEDWLIECY